MTQYLFVIELPPFTEEMTDTIPAHRDYVDKLFTEGAMHSYSVSVQRNMLWCVVAAEDEQRAMELIAAMPMHPFFTDVSCHPLLIHNSSPATLPDISLN
jgi:muconolactone delta-isomerase